MEAAVRKSLIYLILAGFFISDYFVKDTDKPNIFMGLVLIVFSISCVRLMFRKGQITNPAIPRFENRNCDPAEDKPLISQDGKPIPMTIRIWLTGTEQNIPYPYIAELWNFFTATLSPNRANSGPTAHHATLECGEDVYVSFCPQDDLARMDPSKRAHQI